MGAAQSVPVVGEIVTAVDSGARLVTGGVVGAVAALVDDEDGIDCAEKLIKSAGDKWVDYSERNVIAGPVRAVIHSLSDDEEEAKRVLKKCGKSVLELADSTPVVGHVKGLYHYIDGDVEHGNACMKGATRSVAVAGAGALTGGAGLVVGGLTGVAAGTGYDGACTVIETVVKDDYTPSGCFANIDKVVTNAKDGDLGGFANAFVDTALGFGGDFIAGAEASKAAEKVKVARKIKNQKHALNQKIGKEAALDTIEAAKDLNALKESGHLKGDNNVLTRVKDTKYDKAYEGINRRARADVRIKEFQRKGTKSGFRSKTHAKKGHNPNVTSRLEKTAESKGISLEAKQGTRSHSACAEHQAFEQYYARGDKAVPGNARTHTVSSKNGTYVAAKRCNNCTQYGDLMGNVVTDSIDGMPVPVKDASQLVAGAAGSATVAVGIISGRKRRRIE